MEDKVRSCVTKTIAYFFSPRERSVIFLGLHDWMLGEIYLGD
jgi:hypothetical protein